ncbi:hypothetical protein RJT34_11553 [Clitoria ternatea]|uniref:Uncharacterized protein n=1 Tax=Clitoria ternatea TaxID=43366 RepID=A0AAN9JK50_CLITE
MARPLLPSATQNLVLSHIPITLLFAVLALLCVFSVVTFLCGTGKLKKLHTETEGAGTTTRSKLNSNLGNRALSIVKMLSWRKLEEEEEEEGDCDHHEDEENAFWRKNILMGERCRPLNLSTKIEPKNSSS